MNIKRCWEISLTPETKQQELELFFFREHPDEQQLRYRRQMAVQAGPKEQQKKEEDSRIKSTFTKSTKI